MNVYKQTKLLKSKVLDIRYYHGISDINIILLLFHTLNTPISLVYCKSKIIFHL